MSYSFLSFIPWLLVTVVVATLQITAAVILLKERHLGAWLMMAGAVIMLLGQLGVFTMQIALALGKVSSPNMIYWIAISAVSSLGTLLFAVGVLLHALRQRAKANRLAELEAIIASMQSR